MIYSVPDIIIMFFIYGFLGWCLEVAFFGVTVGKFVNRGFLNGPICPIYGVGALIVILSLQSLKDYFILVYILSVIMTSVLELITGMVLEKIYHVRWWDYSNRPFNFKGHICLSFSLLWGVACIVLLYIIHPPIEGLVTHIDEVVKIIALSILGAGFIADIMVTIATLKNLRLRVRMMHEIADKIHDISDGIGKHVFEATENAVKKKDEIMDSDEVKRLREKYRRLTIETGMLQRRIIKAFPTMKSKNHPKIIEHIRQWHEKIEVNKRGK